MYTCKVGTLHTARDQDVASYTFGQRAQHKAWRALSQSLESES